MTPGRDDDFLDEDEELDDEPPRSIFSSAWLRLALVLVVLGVIAVIAAPYVRESMGPEVLSRESSPPAKPAASVAAPPSGSTTPTTVTLPSNQPSLTSITPPPALTEAPKPAPAAARPQPSDATTPRTTDTVRPETTRAATAPRPQASPAVRPEPRRESAKTDGAAGASVADGATIGDVSGDWWVQIAALRDAETARRLTDRLRRQGFRVPEREPAQAAAASTSAAAERYEVFVAGALPAELISSLEPKGLTARGEPGGAVVTPALPRQDAVALASALTNAGFKVELRPTAPARPAPGGPAALAGGDALHRVRVGGFADRGAAVVASRRLEALGYERPFIGRGQE
jgi:sporulation related protein